MGRPLWAPGWPHAASVVAPSTALTRSPRDPTLGSHTLVVPPGAAPLDAGPASERSDAREPLPRSPDTLRDPDGEGGLDCIA
jgi:hypothetical protein